MSEQTPPVTDGPTSTVLVSVDRHGRSVVWMRGEHDLSTVDALESAVLSAVADGVGDVIVDLRAASFIDASTLVVLARARVRLRAGGRELTIRSPSSQARFVIDVCGQSSWLDGHDHEAVVPTPIVPDGDEPH